MAKVAQATVEDSGVVLSHLLVPSQWMLFSHQATFVGRFVDVGNYGDVWIVTNILGKVEEFILVRKLGRDIGHVHAQLVVKFHRHSTSLDWRMVLEM